MMRYCILGATGYIGNYLYNRMKEDGKNVIGSSRNQKFPYFLFDIQRDDYCPKEFIAYHGIKVVIICFAQTKIDLCKEDYANAYQINVVGTVELIKKLENDGCKVIVFSSDNVFGDNRGDYTEQDDLSPINYYGAMKAELEMKIRQYYPQTLVLRLPKVVGMGLEESNLLNFYLDSLKNQKNVYAIKDSKISIVCVEDLYQIILAACQLDLSGLYQVCYEKSYSRTELANIFFSMLGVEKCVYEQELKDFNFKENRPIKMNMINEKIRNVTQYSFQSYEDIVKLFISINKDEITKIYKMK